MTITRVTGQIVLFALFIICTTEAVLASSESRARAHLMLQDAFTEEDVGAEMQFGREVAAQILGQYKLYRDEKLHHYVMLVGNAVALFSSRSEITYRFAILDTDTVNAYAAPGGYIFITLGAIKQMRDEAELAAVLAHEVAHVANRHIVKELNIRGNQEDNKNALLTFLGASSSTAKAIIDQAVDVAMTLLFQRGYQQQDELDSDATAIQLLLSVGYDPYALPRYLKRIAKLQKQGEHGSTHPPSRDRDRQLERIFLENSLEEDMFPTMKQRFKEYVQK